MQFCLVMPWLFSMKMHYKDNQRILFNLYVTIWCLLGVMSYMSYITDCWYDLCNRFVWFCCVVIVIPNWKLDKLKNSAVAWIIVFELREVSSVHPLWPIIMALDPNLVCMGLNICQEISKMNLFHVLRHGYFEVKLFYLIYYKAGCVMIPECCLW